MTMTAGLARQQHARLASLSARQSMKSLARPGRLASGTSPGRAVCICRKPACITQASQRSQWTSRVIFPASPGPTTRVLTRAQPGPPLALVLHGEQISLGHNAGHVPAHDQYRHSAHLVLGIKVTISLYRVVRSTVITDFVMTSLTRWCQRP